MSYRLRPGGSDGLVLADGPSGTAPAKWLPGTSHIRWLSAGPKEKVPSTVNLFWTFSGFALDLDARVHSAQTLKQGRPRTRPVADKWSMMIVAAGIVVAASVVTILFLSPPAPAETRPSAGFPHCLRLLQCGNVPEFAGIPYDQMIIIAKNYDACFEDYKIEQTCNVQVKQDIERFHEMGFVTLR